jgi:hypothetical protein
MLSKIYKSYLTGVQQILVWLLKIIYKRKGGERLGKLGRMIRNRKPFKKRKKTISDKCISTEAQIKRYFF